MRWRLPRRGLVVGKFAPLHLGHEFLLRAAAEGCDHLTVLVYSEPDFAQMPSAVRAGWVRNVVPHAEVLVPVGPPPNEAPGEQHRQFVRDFLAARGIEVDVVYTSEAYGEPLARALSTSGHQVEHRSVDPGRTTVPVSGTQVRSDIHAHRDLLAPSVYAHFTELVVVLGAESTGKSTLVEALAEAYQTSFVPEYGRQVWEQKGGRLELDDYVHIARRHREFEEAARPRANRYVFVDTNALTTMLLCFAYEGDAPPELVELARAAEHRYDHVVLCGDEIPFEQDGWRDDAVWRARAQGMVKFDLAVRGIKATTVTGSVSDRVEHVRRLLSR
jgi:NadR type nicotinamide-nucleotide adenylyltransferase